MARSCGLRIGPRRFELVVLEGSGKKHKVLKTYAGEFPRPTAEQAGQDPAELAAAALREAFKQNEVPKENLGLAIDSRQAAFRLLKMPFSDKAKIESVIKFEVESMLPQWNIDDVVVDFHKLAETEDASELLVTAVQKTDVRKAIDLCEQAGLEPLEAELETTAVVNAALASNLCSVDTAHILVHVGEHSTAVIVVDGGGVRDMRAIPIGILSHEVVHVDREGEEGAEKSEKKDEGDAAPATGTWLDAPPDADELQRRLEQTIKRLRRELGRTVSATRTAHPISSILVCGMDVPGLVGSQILDVPVQHLEIAVEGGPSGAESANFVAAYGAALRQLGGGVMAPSLRREELRYSGAFERVELPLAVVCLLLVTLFGVWNIFLHKEILVVDGTKLGQWRNRSFEMLVGNPKQGIAGTMRSPSDSVKKYIQNIDEEVDLTKTEQVRAVKQKIEEEIRKYEKDLGVDTELSQPQSALAALVLVLDVLEDVASEKDRPSLRRVKASYINGKGQKNDRVKVTLDYSVFADSQLLATQMHERFVEELNQKPWIETRVDAKAADPLENSKGVYVENQIVEVNLGKAPKAPRPN
ncbi:MAG: pilus assembly protein PilM [Planctomycetes bacterium]|nr:pilus assembly protein PilM [Planctomycetota bacterium]